MMDSPPNVLKNPPASESPKPSPDEEFWLKVLKATQMNPPALLTPPLYTPLLLLNVLLITEGIPEGYSSETIGEARAWASACFIRPVARECCVLAVFGETGLSAPPVPKP
jgi:hypothetical protein